MKFQRFLKRIPVPELARYLGCTRASIYNWHAGKSIPPPEKAYRMVRMSGGELTFDDIYVAYLKRKLRNKD